MRKVTYGFVEDQNFVGENNKQAIINYLLQSDDVGFDLVGYICDKCGFIYESDHQKCEICEAPPQKSKTIVERFKEWTTA